MLATSTLPLSLLPPLTTPTSRPSLPSHPRPALTDSTNVNLRANLCRSGHKKGSVYPTSYARTSCATSWNDIESSGSIPTACHPRHHHFPSSPSLFSVTYKAPPTVSISLSAACSQSVPGERTHGSRAQGVEPDLPDVRSVVPFPVTPLDGDTDVDMLDGTCPGYPENQSPSAAQAPRKRRSAHSSVSSQGSIGTDEKQKRPKKSRRQVAELWWLGVVHRSVSRCIETRQSVGNIDVSETLRPGLRGLDAMDHMLIERIQKRLAENGCVEGRSLPNPLPRISSPSISVPSLVLLAPGRKTSVGSSTQFILSSELNSGGNCIPDGTVTCPPAFKASPCAPLPIPSHSPIPHPRPTPYKRHVHFETPQRPPQAQHHARIPRRSPSPPPRTGTSHSNAPTLTLTMPQLVASLTLAYHERSRLRFRGRAYKVAECGDNGGRSSPLVPCQSVRRDDVGAIRDKERASRSITPHARLSSAPERKSPLSRVVYAES